MQSQLTASTHSVPEPLGDQGFAIIPDVVSREKVDRVISEIQAALNAHDATNRSGYAIRHLMRAVPAVKELAQGAEIRALVEPVLGPQLVVVRSLFFDKTTEANWKVTWHQDLTIAVEEKVAVPGFTAWSVKEGVMHVQPPASVLDHMLTVRLHLDDCGAGNGPLEVMPSSHKAGRLNAKEICDLRDRHQAVACIVPRGGAVLMRPLLLHASSPATDPRHRRVVHLEFAAESLPGGLTWAR